MKKYAVLVLMLLICAPVFAQTPAEACKSLQSMAIKNLTNIRSCSDKSSYGFNPGYLFKGIENGKCHYTKVKFESGLNINTLAECYAPISVIQRFADDNLHASREMCNSTGMNLDGYMAKEDESTLEAYCK